MNLCLKKLLIVASVFLLFSCKSMVVDKASTMAAGSDKRGIPVPAKKDAPDPMAAFMEESDPTIVAESLPLIVKMYEVLALSNPTHQGLQIMAGQLNVMYGNLCVQTPAEKFGVEKLEEQISEFNRAKYHYLKGRQYILDVFESRWPGWTRLFLSGDKEDAKNAASKISFSDVNAAYWCAGASLIAWSLDPLDPTILGSIAGPVALLERAGELDPDYSNGAIWDALCQFYAAAPMDFGGDAQRADYCYKEALRASGGAAPGIYVTYAQSFLRPKGDRDGFVEALNKALSIDVTKNPSTKLMSIISQQKAQYLLDHVDDYFVVW